MDLIICYDSQSSSTRMVQRMGRTGRKRDGRVVQFTSEGAERNRYKRNNVNKTRIYKVWGEGEGSCDRLTIPPFPTGHYLWRQEAQAICGQPAHAAAQSPPDGAASLPSASRPQFPLPLLSSRSGA